MSSVIVEEDIVIILNEVSNTCNKLGQEYNEKVKKTRTLSKEAFENLAQIAKKEADNVVEPFGIGAMGVFKAGKSQLINTLVDRNILKVGRTEATSVITELVYIDLPEKEYGKVLFKDGSEFVLSIEDTLKYTDIRSDAFPQTTIDERSAKQALLERVTLYLNINFLRLGRIVDTPGLGGSDMGDLQAYGSISQMDAAMIIFNAHTPGNINELEVASTINRYGREVISILNKIDDGKGNMRNEEELHAIEDFIQKNFHTLAKDEEGRPLIFRYSALEIRKAQKILQDPSTTEDQKIGAEKALSRWGFTDLQSFILSRYFTTNKRKSDAKRRIAQTSILSKMDDLLDNIKFAEDAAMKDYQESDAHRKGSTAALEADILRKSFEVEMETEAAINTHLQSLTQEIEDAFINIVENKTSINVGLLESYFIKEEKLKNDIRHDFNALYPQRRFEEWVDKINAKILTIVYNHWLDMPDESQNEKLSLPSFNPGDFSKLINSFTKLLANLLVTHLLALAAGFIFLPAFGIFISLFLAIIYGTVAIAVKSKKLLELRVMVRDKMQVEFIQVKAEYSKRIREINDQLADMARQRQSEQIGNINNQAKSFQEENKFWNRCHRDISYWRQQLITLNDSNNNNQSNDSQEL